MSEMRELIGTELDAVCGGVFSFSDSFNYVKQTNDATQLAAAVGGNSYKGNGGNATNTQWLNQFNVSII
jgi:hypothetical protein